VVEVPTIEWEKYTSEDPRREDQTFYVGAVPLSKMKPEKNREVEVLRNLSLDHLNPEQTKLIEKLVRIINIYFT
jgi:hypothetical protein